MARHIHVDWARCEKCQLMAELNRTLGNLNQVELSDLRDNELI